MRGSLGTLILCFNVTAEAARWCVCRDSATPRASAKQRLIATPPCASNFLFVIDASGGARLSRSLAGISLQVTDIAFGGGSADACAQPRAADLARRDSTDSLLTVINLTARDSGALP